MNTNWETLRAPMSFTAYEIGDKVGYALFKQGNIEEDGTEIQAVCIDTCLNKESLKSRAGFYRINEEMYVCPVYYNFPNNELGEPEFFMPIPFSLD